MSSPSRSDIELLGKWASGDAGAGNELIERHCDALHRYFVNKVGDELEDLIQQTFLACLESWTRFRHEASFRTFLLGIARFQLYTFYGRQRRSAGNLSVSSLRDPSTSPTGAVSKRQDEQLLLQALRRISLEAQEILELSFWEGLSATEIAAVLDLSLNATYSRLHRAKQALRSALRQLAPDREHYQQASMLMQEAPAGEMLRPER
jgi:RNA polymerase sigma-70 factor (ECF subfamily)